MTRESNEKTVKLVSDIDYHPNYEALCYSWTSFLVHHDPGPLSAHLETLPIAVNEIQMDVLDIGIGIPK